MPSITSAKTLFTEAYFSLILNFHLSRKYSTRAYRKRITLTHLQASQSTCCEQAVLAHCFLQVVATNLQQAERYYRACYKVVVTGLIQF